MTFRACFLTASLLAALTAAGPVAEACSPPQAGLSWMIPGEGAASYPANAFLFFAGDSIGLDGVSVTVDGVPASWSYADPGSALANYTTLAARIEPEPQPGQEVTISGSFCPEIPEGNCAPVTVSYLASVPDLVSPSFEGTLTLQYDVYDHPLIEEAVGSCFPPSDAQFYLRLDGITSLTDETSMFWAITGESAGEAVFRRTTPATAGPSDHAFVLFDDGQVDALSELCFSAELIDAAGQSTGELVETCGACRLRATSEPIDGLAPEPEWTAADRVPGGPCDDGTSSGVGGADGGVGGAYGFPADPTVVEDGCGCRTVGGSRMASPLAWLAGLAFVAGTRRRRR